MRKSAMTVSRLEEQAKKDSQTILDTQQVYGGGGGYKYVKEGNGLGKNSAIKRIK